MRSRLALLSLLLASTVIAAAGSEYRPVRCTERRPYEGGPLDSKSVELPPSDFALGGAFPQATRDRLDRAVAEAAKLTGAPQMTVAIANREGFYAQEGGKLLYWVSVGKAFTATAVLQLVEEGKLRLSDPLSKWFPSFPNAKAITIDDLLLHTAGIFSANEDFAARKSPRYRSPMESIEISARHGAMFCPGQNWRYSNTGYTLLGAILESIEGKPYRQIVQARLLDRLGLNSLRVVEPDDPLSDVAPLLPKGGGDPGMSPSWGGAAGSIVGPAGDMLRFWHALLTGKLLSLEATAGRFARLYPMFDSGTYYGQGVMVYDVPGVLWLGHSGGTPGAKAVVAYSPADRAFVAVAINTDGPAEAVANLMLRTVREAGAHETAAPIP